VRCITDEVELIPLGKEEFTSMRHMAHQVMCVIEEGGGGGETPLSKISPQPPRNRLTMT
jgi:hypothetical protein